MVHMIIIRKIRYGYKIFLLIDNCTGIPKIAGLVIIKIELLPPNSASVIQSMEDVIRSFKSNFQKHLILMLLNKRTKIGITSNANAHEAMCLLNDA